MRRVLIIIVLSLFVSFIFALLVFVFISHGGASEKSLGLGNCGSPLFAFPCAGEFVLPFVIVLIGSFVGLYLLRKYNVPKFGSYLIIIIILQFIFLWPEYILRSVIKSDVSSNDLLQSTQSDLNNVNYEIVVPGYIPNGYYLTDASTFGSNIGNGSISIQITYYKTDRTGEITLEESLTDPKKNKIDSCSNEQKYPCSILKTTNGTTFNYIQSLKTASLKIGSTSISLSADQSISDDETIKIVDSLHSIQKQDFLTNYYLKSERLKQ